MVSLTFQSLVQYSVDTQTGEIKVLKKFTTPIKGTQDHNVRKKQIKSMSSESSGDVYLT